MRYTTVIREMSVLFSGQVMVVSKDTIVIQAIPITRGSLPESLTQELTTNVKAVAKAVPVLFITSINVQGIIQPVPPNFTFGIPVEYWQSMLGPTPLKGNAARWPLNDSSSEAVVGPSLADQYNWTVGTEITVRNYSVKITGILDTRLALLSRAVVMPLTLAQKIYDYDSPKSVNMIIATPVQGYSEKDLATLVEENVTYVKALTEDERNDMIQPVLAQVETWNIGLETVVFAMSVILIMIVTLMSVSERRRDFATLDAIGAPLRYVFRIVILEAALIGVLGGILGIIFGSTTAIVLASLYTNIPLAQFVPSIFDIVPPLYMVEIFAAVVLVSCAGGIIPAVSATRMRIAEALRAEY